MTRRRLARHGRHRALLPLACSQGSQGFADTKRREIFSRYLFLTNQLDQKFPVFPRRTHNPIQLETVHHNTCVVSQVLERPKKENYKRNMIFYLKKLQVYYGFRKQIVKKRIPLFLRITLAVQVCRQTRRNFRTTFPHQFPTFMHTLSILLFSESSNIRRS